MLSKLSFFLLFKFLKNNFIESTNNKKNNKTHNIEQQKDTKLLQSYNLRDIDDKILEKKVKIFRSKISHLLSPPPTHSPTHPSIQP